MNKKNFPSLESLEEEGGFNAGDEVMFDHTDSVAGYEYEYEAMMDGRDEEHCVEAIDGAETEITSLESLLSAIDEARDVGMEAYSAQFASIQISEAQRRYGVNGIEAAFPSMECFQGRQARLAASVSMESVKETIAKIWAWIQAQFKKFVEMIKKFYHHLTKNLDLVIEEANKVKNIARKRSFDGGRTISLGRHAKKITIQGKIPTDLSTITSVLNNVGQANRIPEATFEKIRKDVEDALVRNKEGIKILPASMTGEVPIPADFQLVNSNKFAGGTAGPKRTYVSRTLPGDRAVVVTVFGEDNASSTFDLSSGQFVRSQVSTFWENIQRETETTALSSQDVFTLCQRIVKAAASLKSSRDDMAAHLKRTESTIDAILRKHQGDDAGPIVEGMNKLASWYYRTNAVYAGSLHRHIEGVGYDVCVGFLELAKKSLDSVIVQAEAA